MDLPELCVNICAKIHQQKPTNLGRHFTYLPRRSRYTKTQNIPEKSIMWHTYPVDQQTSQAESSCTREVVPPIPPSSLVSFRHSEVVQVAIFTQQKSTPLGTIWCSFVFWIFVYVYSSNSRPRVSESTHLIGCEEILMPPPRKK